MATIGLRRAPLLAVLASLAYAARALADPPPADPPPPPPPPAAPEQGTRVVARTEPGAATRVGLRGDEATTVPGTFGDPARAVSALPGAGTTANTFGGAFPVRGADPASTGFLVDGYPVLNLFHFGAGPSIIAPEIANSVGFYPANAPIAYSGFTGGLIALETGDPSTFRPHLDVSVDLLRASVFGSVPFAAGRGTASISARRSYFETVLPALAPGLSLDYGDAALRASYRLTDNVRASLLVLASEDTYDGTRLAADNALAGVAANTSSTLSYRFVRAIARLDASLPNALTFRASTMVGADDSRETNAHLAGHTGAFRATGETAGARVSLRARITPAASLTAGLDLLANWYRVGAVMYPDAASIDWNAVPTGAFDMVTAGAFVEEELRLGPLEIVPALRAQVLRYSGHTFALAEPRAVARLRLPRGVTVVAASGLVHQAPQLFQWFIDPGNAVIPPERAWQNSLGVEARLPWALEARVTGFVNSLWNASETTYSQHDGPVSLLQPDTRTDLHGLAYGVEVFLRRKLAHGLYGWIAYTLSRSERAAGDGAPHVFWADQTHVLNVAASYAPGDHWRFGLRFQYASGRPVPAVSAYYDTDHATFVPVSGTDATDRSPAFVQLDLRADYRFTLGPARLSAYLDVLNVTGAPDSGAWSYRYDARDRQPAPGLPVLPSIGLRGEL